MEDVTLAVTLTQAERLETIGQTGLPSLVLIGPGSRAANVAPVPLFTGT
jgi:hypothetical protein